VTQLILSSPSPPALFYFSLAFPSPGFIYLPRCRALYSTPILPTHPKLRQQRSSPIVASSSAAAPAPTPATTPPAWPGAKPIPLLISVSLGLALRFLVPIPAGISMQGWNLLSIFVSTIAGLVLEPLAVGAWAFIAVTTAIATKTLTFSAAFSAFTNDVIWLIVVSFFFARGFEKTGLGERVAQIFVKLFGKSTLGLAYGLSIAEVFIAPAMPSTTARAGGIFMPIINSLSLSAGSKPRTFFLNKIIKLYFFVHFYTVFTYFLHLF